MAIKKEKGFALLVAVIFMSVMLSFGLTLGSIAYKQVTLASGALASQIAFYAADSALECLEYADQSNGGQPSVFAYPASDPGTAPSFSCGGNGPVSSSESAPDGANPWILKYSFQLDSNTHCADVMVSKPPTSPGTTYLYAQGYDVSCAALPTSPRFASRGLTTSYQQ